MFIERKILIAEMTRYAIKLGFELIVFVCIGGGPPHKNSAGGSTCVLLSVIHK